MPSAQPYVSKGRGYLDACFGVDGNLYVVGGIKPGLGFSPVKTVMCYDPVAGKWHDQHTSLNAPRADLTVVCAMFGVDTRFPAPEPYAPVLISPGSSDDEHMEDGAGAGIMGLLDAISDEGSWGSQEGSSGGSQGGGSDMD
jgi:hypothetical protein